MLSMYVAEDEKERAGSWGHLVSEARAMPGNWKQDCKSAESGQEHKSVVTAVTVGALPSEGRTKAEQPGTGGTLEMLRPKDWKVSQLTSDIWSLVGRGLGAADVLNRK